MINMIQNAKDQAASLAMAAYEAAVADGTLPRAEDFENIASVFLQENLRHTARRIDIDQY